MYSYHTETASLLKDCGGDPSINTKVIYIYNGVILCLTLLDITFIQWYHFLYVQKRPLHWAAENDKIALVEMLILAGEDPSIVDQVCVM